MKKAVFLLAAFILSLTTTYVRAEDTLDILGLQVPIISGSIRDSGQQAGKNNVRMAVYTVKRALSEVVDFYHSFLKENNFLLLGGRQDDGSFDAAVKKGDVQFSLRIFYLNMGTVIQFVW